MRIPRPLSLLRLALALALVALPLSVLGQGPLATRFALPRSAWIDEESFGETIAASERYVVMGDRFHLRNGVNMGAAHVFDARSGRYLRRLDPSIQESTANFGLSVAVSGHLAAVGAYLEGPSNRGAVYIFDLRTGRQIHRLVPSAANSLNGMQFGRSVALSGRYLLAGAVGHTSFRGAAFVFDAVAGGEELHMLLASDGANSDDFGEAVALCGNLALVGAYDHDNRRGAAYLFDILSGQQLRKLQASDGASSSDFGRSVALDGSTALVGAKDAPWPARRGAAYLFDITQGTGPVIIETRRLAAPDAEDDDRFGERVALRGSLAAVTAPGRSTPSGRSGVVYLIDIATGETLRQIAPFSSSLPGNEHDLAFCGGVLFASNKWENNFEGVTVGVGFAIKPLAGPLPLATVAAAGSAAPLLEDVSFRSFGAACLNREGVAAFQAALAGPGATRGRGASLWTGGNSWSYPSAVSGLDLIFTLGGNPGIRLISLGLPIHNDPERVLFEGVIAGAAGTGVTPTNRNLVYSTNSGSLNAEVRTGEQLLGDGAALSAFRDLVQGRDLADLGNRRLALAYTLQRGIAGVGAANDSGVFYAQFRFLNLLREIAREGEPAPGGAEYREFFGRVTSVADGEYGYPAWHVLAGESRPIQGLFSDNENGGPALNYERQDEAAGGAGGALHAAFLGETMDTAGHLIYRATLKGNNVSRANNEMLRHADQGPIARKGDQPDPAGLPGVLINRFLGYWPAGDGRALFLAALSGAGVNRNNDLALFLWDENAASLQLLLREGASVCDCDNPLIRVIQRVDVDPVSGKYVVLASLTGNRAKNQALLAGDAGAGNATTEQVLRSPFLKLRKGAWHSSLTSAVTTIRSMTLTAATDRGGAGGKGKAQVVNPAGEIVLNVEFDNRMRELVVGRP